MSSTISTPAYRSSASVSTRSERAARKLPSNDSFQSHASQGNSGFASSVTDQFESPTSLASPESPLTENINGVVTGGKTPLWLAVENGNAALVQSLLERGAAPFAFYGNVPLLHLAASLPNPAILKALATQPGMDLEMRDADRRTPFQIAVANRQWDNANWLLERGADVNARDGHGKTILDRALEQGDGGLAWQLINRAGAGLDRQRFPLPVRTLNELVRGGKEAWLDERLAALKDLDPQEAAAQLEARDLDGRTPYLNAAETGQVRLMKRLQKAGADVRATTPEHYTSLHLAAAHNQPEVIHHLLGRKQRAQNELHADTPLPDWKKKNPGATALHLAVQAQHDLAVQALLVEGAGLETPGTWGLTALALAQSHHGEAYANQLREWAGLPPESSPKAPLKPSEEAARQISTAEPAPVESLAPEALAEAPKAVLSVPPEPPAPAQSEWETPKKVRNKAKAKVIQASRPDGAPQPLPKPAGDNPFAALPLPKATKPKPDVQEADPASEALPAALKDTLSPSAATSAKSRKKQAKAAAGKAGAVKAKTDEADGLLSTPRPSILEIFQEGLSLPKAEQDAYFERLLTPEVVNHNILEQLSREAGPETEAKSALESSPTPADQATPNDTARYKILREKLPPLQMAILKQNESLTRLLLTRGADPLLKNSLGETAFHTAAMLGKVDILDALHTAHLQAKNAKPRKQPENLTPWQDNHLNTPLHYAALRGQLASVEWFLAQTPFLLNQGNAFQETALHHASEMGQTDIVKTLLGHGADPGKITKAKLTALHSAAKASVTRKTSNWETLLTLLQWTPPLPDESLARPVAEKSRKTTKGKAKNPKTNPPPKAAFFRPFNVNALAERDSTPLLMAIAAQDYLATQVLLRHGADFTQGDTQKITPLHLALGSGQWDLAGKLLKVGASALARRDDGSTPLHQLAALSITDMPDRDKLESLLDAALKHIPSQSVRGEAPVDVRRTKDQFTALHLAALQKNKLALEKLLAAGADATLRNRDGLTALHLALVDRTGVIPNPGVLDVLLNLPADQVRHMLEIPSKAPQGLKPLHMAAMSNQPSHLIRLHASGLLDDVDQRDQNGNTALHWAAVKGNYAVLTYLLGQGADPTAQNALGSTPLSIASQFGNLSLRTQMTALLKDHQDAWETSQKLLLMDACPWDDQETPIVGASAESGLGSSFGSNGIHALKPLREQDRQAWEKAMRQIGPALG